MKIWKWIILPIDVVEKLLTDNVRMKSTIKELRKELTKAN